MAHPCTTTSELPLDERGLAQPFRCPNSRGCPVLVSAFFALRSLQRQGGKVDFRVDLVPHYKSNSPPCRKERDNGGATTLLARYRKGRASPPTIHTSQDTSGGNRDRVNSLLTGCLWRKKREPDQTADNEKSGATPVSCTVVNIARPERKR